MVRGLSCWAQRGQARLLRIPSHVLGKEMLYELLAVLYQERLPVRSPGDHVSASILLDLLQDVVELGREQPFVLGAAFGIVLIHGRQQ
jgi:hypothetical protein